MDVVDVASKIEELVGQIRKATKELDSRAKAKADAIRKYRQQRAKVLIQLKNGVEFSVDGEKICTPPATLAENIARGICYQEKYDEDLAVSQYKNLIVGIEALKAELNGWQSIYRHLTEK